METFADYILAEQNTAKKMEIAYHFGEQANCFFNSSVVLKAELADMFMDKADLNVDRNLVNTAILVCACKKSDNPKSIESIRSYAKESAEFLETLGFSDRFCKICEEQNRYSGSEPREVESDILELVDNFGGMLMHRPERKAFTVEEATNLLVNRNLKGKDNRFLDEFVKFVDMMEQIKVSEKNVIDDSISYIAHLGKIANESSDVTVCINKIVESRDLLSSARVSADDEKQVEDHVITEILAEDIKKRIEEGEQVSSAVIHDDGYVVNTENDAIKLSAKENQSLQEKKDRKIHLTINLEKARQLDREYKELFGNEKGEIA